MIKQINEESLIETCKKLIWEESFYGLFLMTLHKEWTDKIRTTGVGKHGINVKLYINEIFWESLKKIWKLGMLKHDVLHVVFHHIELAADLAEKDIVQIASNLVVNQYINPEWLPLFDVKYKDYTDLNKDLLEMLHEDLRLKRKTREEVIEELRQIPPRGIYFQDFAELNLKPKEGLIYYYNELLKYKQKNPQEGSKGYCKVLSDTLRDIADDFPTWDDHSSWTELEGLSESELKLMRDQIDYQLKEIAEQVTKSRGEVPAELKEYIDSLDKTEPPKFNWRSYLRRFAGGSEKVDILRSRAKPNLRYPDNPGRRIRPKARGIVYVDTSGSHSSQGLKESFHEIYHMHKMGFDIEVGQFDAGLHSVLPYKKNCEDKIKITGRGGTDFQVCIDHFNENKHKYDFCIVITDGECPAPDNQKGRVLWVLTPESNGNDDLQPQIKLN